jgi:lysophospholipase L1-like esterase
LISDQIKLGVVLCASLLLCVLSTGLLAAEEDHPVEDASKFKLQNAPDPSLPTLWLVGDSTMKVGTPGQRGWGDEVAPYFDLKKINVVNEAIGGRSSRTYQNEGRWDALLPMIQKGDFVIVEFGHNDGGPINEKPPVTASTRARGTIKGVGEETQEVDNILTHKHEVVHTFGWYMRKYVTDIQARGATPIVMSLVPRNSWQDGKVVRASGNGYGGWAQQAAQATHAIFVDHNEIIAEGLDKLGEEKGGTFFADHRLHATPEGAAFNAKMAVSGLRAIDGKPLEQYLSDAGKAVEPFTPAQ